MKQFHAREHISAVVLLAALLAGFSSAAPAHAAMIAVTTFADALSSPGDCSLREAIQAANTDAAVDACPAGSGADIIQLSAGTYTLALPIAMGGGDISISGELTIVGIDGNTVHIDGGSIDRIFTIQPGAVVTLRGFELTHGASAADGGGIYNDQGTLTLDNVNVTHSTAAGKGGGIYNDHGLLTLSGGISDNSAGGNGGGIDNTGGTLIISAAQLNNNVASGSGGAISNDAALTLDRVWLHDNMVNGNNNGGGIYNRGMATISNSYIHKGYALLNGGNIYSGDNSNLSSLSISNTTISQGTSGANGGGLFNDGALQLTNVTVADNSAASGSGIYNNETTQPVGLTNTTIVSNTNSPSSPGAGISNGGAAPTLKNTLIAYNGALGNCSGSISSAGHNLTSDATCTPTGPSDLTNTNPLLSPLQDNGGVMFAYGGAAPSYALLPGSPAINAGTNAGCPAVDQRGMARPHGANCDIGAYEANDAPQASADSYSTNEDTPLIVGAPGLLSNDVDPDNDVITATLLIAPSHGTLVVNQSGAFSYTPSSHYHGQDGFSYRISDGDLISASTLVTLTIIHVNHAPIAANDAASTPIDTQLLLPVAVLLGNDSDNDGDALVISDVRSNSARGGRVMLAGDHVVYTPPAGFSGVDSLIYTLSDGAGGTANGTVTVTVGLWHLYLPAARR
jgi:CSLREA domain-containing protein